MCPPTFRKGSSRLRSSLVVSKVHGDTRRSLTAKGCTQAAKKPESNPRLDFYSNTVNFPTALIYTLAQGLRTGLNFQEGLAGLLVWGSSPVLSRTFKHAGPMRNPSILSVLLTWELGNTLTGLGKGSYRSSPPETVSYQPPTMLTGSPKKDGPVIAHVPFNRPLGLHLFRVPNAAGSPIKDISTPSDLPGS